MRLSEQIIIGGLLLVSYFVVVYTFFGNELNWKCKLAINYTHLREDEKQTFASRWYKYQTCYNATFRNTNRERNLTRHEYGSCLSKCSQITDGRATEDGSLNPKLSEIIENMYKKYTNATPSYIKKIDSIHRGCANEANSKIKFLQKNGTVIGECELNGLYDDCCSFTYWKLLKNYRNRNTTIVELKQVCGDQLGME